MAKVGNSKVVTSSMPKTGWREPACARDDLLKLPKGRPLTPTNEVHEPMPVEAALDAEVVDVKAPVSTADQTSHEEQQTGEVPVGPNREVTMGQQDTIVDDTEEYEGDAEGYEAADDMADMSSSIAEEDATFVPGTAEELHDGSSEDESLPTPAASSPRPVPASKHRARALRNGTESIRPHPTDTSKIIVTYSCTNPAGGSYVQETEVPVLVSNPANALNETGGVIFPDVETSKVPRKKKGSPWMPVHGTSGYEWTRGEGEQKENWRINVFFRRLDRDTHAFRDIYVNTNILKNIDPNDKKFRTAYNKWILQFARRRDASYTQKVVRVHWSVAERRALYASTNRFCAKFGIHRFGFTEDCKLSTNQLQLMADAVNTVPNPLRLAPRGVDAVRGQIVSAHDKAQPKNKEIYDLMVKARALRARLASGEVIARAERKPKFAIPLSDFPVDPPAAAPSHGRKRKLSDTEPCSSELSSSPPASEDGRNNDVVGGAWIVTNDGVRPEESERGDWSDTSDELLSSEERAKTERLGSSPPMKKARTK